MTASLIHTLTSMDQPIIPAAGDGQTMTLLSQSSFPAIFLDGTLTTQTLLAENNQGLLTLSEYAKFCRDMQLKKTSPLIYDLQSGFGSPLNTYYAAQELERSGADTIILNDQTYPSHSLNRPTTTTPADLLGKAKAAQDGLENDATELWIKLEGIWDYGTKGILQRIHYLANIGADAIIIDHYTDDQLNTIIAATPELPTIATWTPNTPHNSGITAWLDTGCLARQAQQARQQALTELKKGAIAYAEK